MHEARSDFPSTQPEVERWAKGPYRDRLALGYMVCFMLGALERSRSGTPSDYRWIANTSKAIVNGVPDAEAQLEFEVSDATHTFESAPLRQILGELLSSRLLNLGCEYCGEPFVTIVEEQLSPWEPRAGTRKCRRCGKPFDRRFANFRMSDHGLEWMTEWAAPLLEDHTLAIMTKTMVLGTTLLHRDGRSQFDFASDTAVKISELKDLPQAYSFPPSAMLAGNAALSMNEVYTKCLGDLLSGGESILPGTDAPGMTTQLGERPQWVKQVRDYKFTLLNPLDRLLTNSARAAQQPDIMSMAGQLVWHFSGNNDLAPVRFYNPRADAVSDDGRTIRGSDYGYRLLNRAGDQVARAIERLRSDPSSRRTFCSIYDSQDGMASSRDIPCPIGIEFLVADGKLHATAVMRSNNAYTVLPFNVMFFTFLQEIVAGELQLPIGSYSHFAVSMHYLEKDEPRVKDAINAPALATGLMRPIGSPEPMKDVKALVAFERQLREDALTQRADLASFRARAMRFQGSIRDLSLLLVMHAARRMGSPTELELSTSGLDAPIRSALKGVKVAAV